MELNVNSIEQSNNEDSVRLSDQLIQMGMISKDDSGAMSFTDLGKRTLQFMRLLHGRLAAPNKKAAKRPRGRPKSVFKRKKSSVSLLKLKKSGQIFNHRLATFAKSAEADRLIDLLKKKGLKGITKPALESKRCHVLVPFDSLTDSMSALREFRSKEAS